MANVNLSFVVDANVFIKLLIDEHDSSIAEAFFIHGNLNDYQFIVPSLFVYEVISIATKAQVDIQTVFTLLNDYQAVNLVVAEPILDDWQLATKICQDGNAKSGYPSMYDSIYHAMAINKNSYFITADNRHIAKVKNYGNICLLDNWQTLVWNLTNLKSL